MQLNVHILRKIIPVIPHLNKVNQKKYKNLLKYI